MADTNPPISSAAINPVFVDEDGEDEVRIVDEQIVLKSVKKTVSRAKVVPFVKKLYCDILRKQVAALQDRLNPTSEHQLNGLIVHIQKTKNLAQLAKIWEGHLKSPMEKAESELITDAQKATEFYEKLPSRKLQARFLMHFLKEANDYRRAIKQHILLCKGIDQDLQGALSPKRLRAVKMEAA